VLKNSFCSIKFIKSEQNIRTTSFKSWLKSPHFKTKHLKGPICQFCTIISIPVLHIFVPEWYCCCLEEYIYSSTIKNRRQWGRFKRLLTKVNATLKPLSVMTSWWDSDSLQDKDWGLVGGMGNTRHEKMTMPIKRYVSNLFKWFNQLRGTQTTGNLCARNHIYPRLGFKQGVPKTSHLPLYKPYQPKPNAHNQSQPNLS
jgi:hypothetical protein